MTSARSSVKVRTAHGRNSPRIVLRLVGRANVRLGLFLGPIPIVVFSFGVFLRPLIQEFHSGRGAVSLAFTLHNTILAFGLPFAGRLVDRFGARRVILPSTFTVGLILLSAYFCSGRIWQLYLFYVGHWALPAAGWRPCPTAT